MSDYADILNQQWDEIPEVAVLPSGSYRLRARKASYQPAKSADGNPSFMFVYTVKEPMSDVSDDELAALGENYDVGANRIFTRIWVESNADMDNVRKHLAKHGVDAKGKTLQETLKEFEGKEVIAFLNQRTFTNNAGEQVLTNEASQFAPTED